MVLFCCDVGVSGLELKVTPWGSNKSSSFKGLKSEKERSGDDIGQ